LWGTGRAHFDASDYFLRAFFQRILGRMEVVPFAVPVWRGLPVSLNDENHASYPLDGKSIACWSCLEAVASRPRETRRNSGARLAGGAGGTGA